MSWAVISDARMVEIAKANAQAAGVAGDITFGADAGLCSDKINGGALSLTRLKW